MARKNNLLKFKTIDAEAMDGNITSEVTNIEFLDNIGVQFNFTGSPEGTFEIQVSADYARDNNGNVTDAGNWVALTLSPTPAAAGAPDSVYVDLNQLSAPWIRAVYTNSLPITSTVTAVADVSGSLNSKCFLIDGADGDNWYVWMDDGLGVDPNLPSRTGIQVMYSDDDDANAVATAIGAALAACTSVENVVVLGPAIEFDQTVGPGGSAANASGGNALPGFTFANVVDTDGVLDAFITGKML